MDRFNLILREFMDRSQFLVITHNKRTMGYADTLYGVTMPEPGVSKRIAIKYAEIEKHLPMEQMEAEAEANREAAQRELEQVEKPESAPETPEPDTTPTPEPAQVEEEPIVAGGSD